MNNEWYNKWTARFATYSGNYKVEIFNHETIQFEPYLCSLECAVAFLESVATDYEFEPSKMLIKRGLTRKISYRDAKKEWFEPDYRYAEYEGMDGEPYRVHFGCNRDNEVYLT